MIHDYVVPIFAAEAVVPIGCEHLDFMPFDAHDSHVECAATEIENEYGLVLVQLVQSKGQCRGSWLIDNLKDVQSSNLACCYCRGPLSVIEIRRNRDHCICDRLFQILLRIRF